MKSRITRISYTEVKNLGGYETCRVEAEAEVAKGESPAKVMGQIKRWVGTQLDEGPWYDPEDD